MKNKLFASGVISLLLACGANENSEQPVKSPTVDKKSPEIAKKAIKKDDQSSDQFESNKNFEMATIQLSGQETKNGDWTFANRGRDMLLKAVKHLAFDAQRIPVNGLDVSTEDKKTADFFLDRNKFIASFNKFITSFKIPSNDELMKLKLNENILKTEGKQIELELKYFLLFGRSENYDETVKSTLELKKLILAEFFKANGFKDFQMLANLFLEQTSLKSGGHNDASCSFKTLVDGQVDNKKLYSQVGNVMTYHLNEFISFKIKLDNIINNKSIIRFGHTNWTAEKKICNDHYVSSNISLPLKLEVDNNIVWNDIFSIGSYIQIENIGTLPLMKVSYSGNDIKTFMTNFVFYQKYNSLFAKDYKEKTNLLGTDLMSEYFSVASKMLNHAKESLVLRLMNTPSDKVIKILQNYGWQSNQETFAELIEYIKQLRIMSLADASQVNLSIKNFDYTHDVKSIFVTSSFYFNYGNMSTRLDKAIAEQDIQIRILHEVSHLFNIKEENSHNFALDLLKRINSSQENFKNIGLFQVSNNQLSSIEVTNLHNQKKEELVKKTENKIINFLKSKNIEVHSASYISESKYRICEIKNVSQFECLRDFDFIHGTDEIKYILKTSKGTLSLKLNLVSGYNLEQLGNDYFQITSFQNIFASDKNGTTGETDVIDNLSINIVDVEKNEILFSLTQNDNIFREIKSMNTNIFQTFKAE